MLAFSGLPAQTYLTATGFGTLSLRTTIVLFIILTDAHEKFSSEPVIAMQLRCIGFDEVENFFRNEAAPIFPTTDLSLFLPLHTTLDNQLIKLINIDNITK
jgi:hypothetical protein